MKMINRFLTSLKKHNNQEGASAIFVGIAILFIIIPLAALAIDLGHLYVVRTELQNAADAGSHAGATELYYDTGSAVNAGQAPTSDQPLSANQVAFDAATTNTSDGTAVEVNWTSGNTGDVQRGHWSFGLTTDLARGFYPNASIAPTVIAGVSEEDLDKDINFINAVRVVTRRQTTPARTFFAKFFGIGSHTLSTEAIAYRGFAGSLEPDEVDQPIVICLQSIWNDKDNNGEVDPDEEIDCSYGRMLNSGSNPDDHNTGGWTDFSQRPCTQTSAQEMNDILSDCTTGNPRPIYFLEGIGATGGVVDNIFGSPNQPNQPSFFNCWKSGLWDADGDLDYDENDHPIDNDGDGWPEYPWAMTLPVIDCTSNNVQACDTVLGAVSVYVVWIIEKVNKPGEVVPLKMHKPDGTLWEEFVYTGTSDEDGLARWDNFATEFNLRTVDGDIATVANDGFKKKSIYFYPVCDYTEPAGTSGGHNFGILAKIPVLVD
jgi:Flp pilus assembly protein TadG